MSPPVLLGKKGVCFTLRKEGQQGSWNENLPKILALQPYWNYSWGMERIDQQPAFVEFVPMVWGWYPQLFADCCAQEQDHLARAPLLLAFNEPDKADQAHMTVERAVEAWPQLEAVGLPLVSPSCAQIAGPWMVEFLQQMQERGLRVDAIGFHDYGGGSVSHLQKTLIRIHETYQRPIIITEFAVADWSASTPSKNKHKPEKVLRFMKEILPWLEEQDWILGYAWFSFEPTSSAGCCSALFDSDGNLTELGRFYSEFRANTAIQG